MSTPEHKFGKEISDELAAAGFTVIDMESLGNGVPDRIAFKDGKAFLFETKIESNGLTDHQEVWIKTKYKNNLPYYLITKGKAGIYFYQIYYINKEIKMMRNPSFWNRYTLVQYLKGGY